MSGATNPAGFGDTQEPMDDDMYLDRPLKEYARSFSYPATPNIAVSVRERLAREGQTASTDRSAVRPRLAWIAVALLVVSLAAALLTPDVQAFVRYILRIGSVEITVATPTPTGLSQAGTSLPTQLPTVLEKLVGRTTLEDARAQVMFPLKRPADLGPPDLVYLQDPQSIVVFVWLDPRQPGKARLSLFHLLEFTGMAGKMVTSVEVIEETTVNGNKAAWVRGPHTLVFQQQGVRTGFEQHMLVEGNVLVWEDNAVTYRLETDMSREQAIKIAESLVDIPRK